MKKEEKIENKIEQVAKALGDAILGKDKNVIRGERLLKKIKIKKNK
jgi:hypothetical protein